MRIVPTVCVLVCNLALPGAVAAGDQPRASWWLDRRIQQELGLTQSQIQTLQLTFEHDLPERRALRRELDRLESKLQKLLERAEDDSVVERFSARVEQVRAKRNVRRTLVLLEMYKSLTPTQRIALSRLQATSVGPERPSTQPRPDRR
jgi:Spy/CpxP family protein refolding chaperone